ncbi:autotransporter-associated beta strand repeat-containing protein [Candidatus Akkermansia timonensis]|nr:autotransporter-associated beta strand repeat-containing protein [Candidatus Akkermansia timonensis]QWO96429.1 autotransporter-associated beta strand repeat-containing protein [Candidatus Akkermansia timonensis]
MRLHLPPRLRSALIASLVSFAGFSSFSAQAATSADFWQAPAFGGTEFTWTGGGDDNAVGTAGNWEGDAAPSRPGDTGPHLIFNDVNVTVTGAPPSTSDQGGISVTGNSNVTVGMGPYAGSIFVGSGSTLSTSFGTQIKNSEAEGHANVYVDGTLNLTTPSGNLNLDNGPGAGNHYWHIGLNGLVNLANTSTVTKNGKTWNVEVVVANSMEDASLTNRTLTTDMVLTRKFMAAGADLGSSLDNLLIWKQTGEDAYEALTQVNSADQLGAGDFLLVSTGSGMSVQYKGAGYAAETLIWKSDSGTWSNKGTGWYKEGDGGKTDTSFLNGDSVIFNADEGNKTVTVSGAIDVKSMTFEDGTVYSLLLENSASLAAESVILGNNAELTLGSDASRFSSFSSEVSGSEGASLSVWLTASSNGNNTVSLGAASGLENVYINGTLAANLSGAASSTSMGDAVLHMNNGSTFLIRSGAGNTVAPASRMVVEGNMTFELGDGLTTASAFTTNIVGGDSVAASNELIFKGHTGNVTITGDIDYAGRIGFNEASGGYGPSVTFKDNTIQVGSIKNDYCTSTMNFNNSQVTAAGVYMASRWDGSQIVLNQGTEMSTGQLRLGDRNGDPSTSECVFVINSGATLNVTGTNNGHANTRSLLLAHWAAGSGRINLQGGTLNSLGATMFLAWAGTEAQSKGTFSAAAGTANLLGMDFWGESGGVFKGQFLLGTATTGDARVNFGTSGITNFAGSSVIQLGEGTLGALDNWSLGYNTNYTGSFINLVGSINGTIIDTVDANDGTTARTITFQNGLTGSGKLVKTGAGTLVLNGTAKVSVPAEGETAAVPGFTGTVELREGNLTVKDSSVIGQGTLLIGGGLNVAVTSDTGYSLDAGSTLGTTNIAGGTATLGAALTLNGGALSFDSLSTDTAALTVNSVTGTAATDIQLGISSITTSTEYALLHGTGLTDFSMFTLGGAAAELYKATFTVNDNTLYISLADKEGLLRWKSGNWSTSGTDLSWDLDGTPSAYTDGQTVYFSNGDGVNKNVTIVGDVAPGKINVVGTDFVFAGDGSITGETTLNLLDGASLTLNNTNSYSGDTVLYDGSKLTVVGGALGTSTVFLRGNSVLEITSGAWNGLGTRLSSDSTGTLKLSGSASGTTTDVLTKVSYEIGAGTRLTLSAGTYGNTITGAGNLWSASGTTVLKGKVDIGGEYRLIGVRDTASNWTLDSNATLTAGSFIGRYEFNGTTTLNINEGAVMNITGTLQAARDGKSVMNIARDAMVLAQTLDMGQNWAGSEKGVTINLNGGSLMLGAGGIVATGHANTINLNINSGTLGTTAAEGWSAAQNMTLGGELTVDTRQYDAATKSYNDQPGTTITLGGVLSGTGSLVKNGSGTLTLSAQNTYTGRTTVNGGTLAFTNTNAMTLGSISMGAGARMTTASGLTLNSGATLTFDMTGLVADQPIINIQSGALALTDANCTLTLNNYGDLEASDYILAQWATAGSLTSESFTWTPEIQKEGFEYSVVVEGNRLVLKVKDVSGDTGFVWNGGTNRKWLNSSTDGWTTKLEGVTTLDDQEIYFTSAEAGEVKVSGNVTPKSVIINSGTYTFVSDPDNAGAIADSTDPTTLTVNGNSNVSMNLANTYTGGTILNGGTLTIGAVNALGTDGAITFNGGTLAYADSANGTDVTGYDISGRIAMGDGGALNVSVMGAGDTVTWSGLTAGVMNTAATTLTKTGAGTLALAYADASLAHLTVQEGTLAFTSGATLGVNPNNATIIRVNEGATLALAGGTVNLHAQLNGAGTITIGTADSAEQVSVTNTGNNNFTGRLELLGNGENMNTNGNRVAFGTGGSLGAGTVFIDGKGFHFSAGTTAANMEIGARHGTVQDGSSGGSYTFSGAISGSGYWGLVQNVKLTNILTGPLKDFRGTLSTNATNNNGGYQGWNFGNGGACTTGTGNAIFGNGAVLDGNAGSADTSLAARYTVNYNNAELLLNATVQGNASLTQAGTGTLILDKTNTATGDLGITNAAGIVQLGTAGQAAQWSGTTLSGAGTLKIVNGNLTSAMTRAEGSTAGIVVDSAAVINLGGTNGDMLTGITLVSGGKLAGVSGDITIGEGATGTLNLTLGTANVGEGAAGTAMIDQGNGNLIINDSARVDLDVDAIVDTLIAHKNAGTESWLTLTTGTLQCDDLANIQFSAILSNYGIRVKDANGGSLVLSGQVSGLYMVDDTATSDPDTVTHYGTLGMYSGVVIGQNKTLTVQLAGAPGAEDGNGAVINNLLGGTGSTLKVENTNADGGNAVVILNNERLETGLPAPNDYAGADTIMGGSIVGENGVTFVKQNTGNLKVNGSFVTDTLRVEGGTLTLDGTGNDFDHVVLAGTGAASSMVVGKDAVMGDLTDEGEGGTLSLGSGANVTINGASSLDHSTIGGNGALVLNDKLTLSGTAGLRGGNVVELVKNDTASGTLDIGSTTGNAVSGLGGAGTLKGNGGDLSVNSGDTGSGHVFSGTLEGKGTLSITGKAGQVLNNVVTASGSSWALNNSGRLDIRMGGTVDDPKANTALTLSSLTLGSGSTTNLTFNTDYAGPIINVTGNISISQGADIVLSSTGKNELVLGADGSYTLMQGAGDIDLDGSDKLAITLDSSAAFKKFESGAYLTIDGGNLVLVATASRDNKYARVAHSFNSRAGAELLWNLPGGIPGDSLLKQVDDAIGSLTASNPGEAARAMAAVAGSTVNALGTAQRDALREQMGWIRNRTNQMGVNPAYINEDLPYFHMWMEGTGSYAQLDTKGDESGYKLTTWGGTFGVDVDLSDSFTMGAAFTANYGDLTASAADTADGHLDSYYANLFGRYQSKRWAHTLILTGGWNDAKLNRTVDYGAGSYRTEGSTNGWGLGAMYELTYDIYLNENRSSILQPLFNASVVTTRMDGYREMGAGNAGLSVDKQEWTTGTLALGGRWMGLVGSNLFGREALAELRVNAAQDLGDDRGETAVGFLANPGYMQQVRGAKVGRTALQIGAGLSVPVGTQGTIFVNGNADIRNGASSLNGSIGYRYDF